MSVGCTDLGPPDSISLDPLFSEPWVEAAKDARDMWCQAAGWCPLFVTDGQAHVHIVHGPVPVSGRQGLNDHQGGVFIWAEDVYEQDRLTIMAHEFGHFGIHGHPTAWGDLMSTHYPNGEGPQSLTPTDISAWCEEQNCFTKQSHLSGHERGSDSP